MGTADNIILLGLSPHNLNVQSTIARLVVSMGLGVAGATDGRRLAADCALCEHGLELNAIGFVVVV